MYFLSGLNFYFQALEFLSKKGDSSSSTSGSHLLLPMEDVQGKLRNFLQNDSVDYDHIFEWIKVSW